MNDKLKPMIDATGSVKVNDPKHPSPREVSSSRTTDHRATNQATT